MSHSLISARRNPEGRRDPLVARLHRAFQRAAQRRELARLDDALLDDLGITREQAEREASRPLWDGPDHWRN